VRNSTVSVDPDLLTLTFSDIPGRWVDVGDDDVCLVGAIRTAWLF